MYKYGTIVLVPFPFTDLSGMKVRPAVIISNKLVGNDIIVAFISTNIKNKEKFGVMVKMDKYNGLKSNSIILLSKVATLEKKIILGEIGRLSNMHIVEIKNKLKTLFL